MSLENQTIGFIENCYRNIYKIKRQQKIGNYKVDLYFIDYNLIIECDENNHLYRDFEYESKREEFLISMNNIIIRFNPNNYNFDLSEVINEINKVIINKDISNKIIRLNNDDSDINTK